MTDSAWGPGGYQIGQIIQDENGHSDRLFGIDQTTEVESKEHVIYKCQYLLSSNVSHDNNNQYAYKYYNAMGEELAAVVRTKEEHQAVQAAINEKGGEQYEIKTMSEEEMKADIDARSSPGTKSPSKTPTINSKSLYQKLFGY